MRSGGNSDFRLFWPTSMAAPRRRGPVLELVMPSPRRGSPPGAVELVFGTPTSARGSRIWTPPFAPRRAGPLACDCAGRTIEMRPVLARFLIAAAAAWLAMPALPVAGRPGQSSSRSVTICTPT
jgi:hypothetical protein